MKSEERNPRRVAIVAGGIVSPLGFGLTETLQSLQQGRDCVTPVSTFSVEKTRCKTAAQIDDGRLLSNANRPPAGAPFTSRLLHGHDGIG